MIEDEVLDFIATKFSSDVRKLEGSLNELFFKAILDNPGIIDLKFARSVFEDEPVLVVEDELNVSRIKKCVCDYYGLTQTQIESKSRTKQISMRGISRYICAGNICRSRLSRSGSNLAIAIIQRSCLHMRKQRS